MKILKTKEFSTGTSLFKCCNCPKQINEGVIIFFALDDYDKYCKDCATKVMEQSDNSKEMVT